MGKSQWLTTKTQCHQTGQHSERHRRRYTGNPIGCPKTTPSPRAARPIPVTVELTVAGTILEKRAPLFTKRRFPTPDPGTIFIDEKQDDQHENQYQVKRATAQRKQPSIYVPKLFATEKELVHPRLVAQQHDTASKEPATANQYQHDGQYRNAGRQRVASSYRCRYNDELAKPVISAPRTGTRKS